MKDTNADVDVSGWKPRSKIRFTENVKRCKRRAIAVRADKEKQATGKCLGSKSGKLTRRIKRCLNVVTFGADPCLDSFTFVSLVVAAHYWWAVASAVCLSLPWVIIWLAFNHPRDREKKPKRQDAFKKAFGHKPSFFRVLLADVRVCWCELRGTATLEQQCFLQLRLLTEGTFEAFPWTLFQTYIAWRQTSLDVEVVNPYLLAISLPQSMFTVYMAYSFLRFYSNMTHEGNVWSFLDNLLLLGEGMAPPVLLDELQHEREVRVTRESNLEHLDSRGLMSIARSISSSSKLESVMFESTGIEESPGGKDIWGSFVDEMTWNRKRLTIIAFTPAINIPVRAWNGFGYAQRLKEVKNGEQVLYSFDEKWDLKKKPSRQDLFAKIESHDRAAVAEAANGMEVSDVGAGAQFAASVGHWRSLAALLSSKPALSSRPALLKRPLLRDAASEGHRACIHLLLAWGADPDQDSALYFSATCGSSIGVSELLKARADPNLPSSSPPLSAVSWVDRRDSALVRGLQTRASCFVAPPDITRALLGARAEPNQRCQEGNTPLWWCAHRSAPKVAQSLINARADIEAIDAHEKRTPLIVAAEMGSAETARVLLRARADIHAKNKQGRTAMQVAQNEDQHSFSQQEMMNVLRKAAGSGSCMDVAPAPPDAVPPVSPQAQAAWKLAN